MTATESVYTDGENGRRDTDTQRAAAQYRRAGLAIIPVAAGEKNPNRRGWQNERWELEDVPELWNNGQGVGVLWGEPSGGLVDVDLDWREARIAASYILPATRTFGRPGAPESHRVYRVTDTPPKSTKYKIGGDGPERCAVEVLSTGAQSLVPPSLHASGERREWHQKRPAFEIDGAALMEGVADVATAALIARNWPGQGARHDYALAATGYVGRYLSRERAERVMEAAISASGDEEPTGRLRDVSSTLDNLEGGRPATGGPTLDALAPGVVDQLRRWHGWGAERNTERNTDNRGDASRAEGKSRTPTHDELRDRWVGRYPHRAHGLGEWRLYDNGVWQPVAETSVKAEVSGVVEAAKPEGVKPTSALITSVVEMARIKVFVPDERWDAEPDILVCNNGALRISSGELLEHRPGHYATSALPYDYDPGVSPVMWRAFLKETVGGAAEFLQEFAGYALTTDTSHEIAVWLHGPRGSGKSTFIAGLQAMLGHRAGVLGLADLERSRFTLASLPGKTLMVAREQPSSYLASTDVLDTIISGEPLQVEQKYRDPYTVIPRAKVCWAMNELPRVANANAGIFRRVSVVAFPELPADQRDPGVKRQIEAEGAGILNWALEGLYRLKARGHFEIPASVRDATAEFEESNDVAAAFLDAECVRDRAERITGQRLYEAYSDWCKANGHKPLSSTRAPQEWKRLGLERKRIKGTTHYEGVRLKLSSEFA
jgi:P4 family phage/plasmid primase-like protien